MNRPSWDAYFMGFARLAATRGSCDRKQVGAVLVNYNRVIATGYNGAAPGLPTCLDEGHLLVDMGGRQSCVRTIHAEQNAIIQCANLGVKTLGATIYTTASPCFECLKAIVAAGIAGVVFDERYDSARSGGIDLPAIAKINGIWWRQLTD